MQLQVNGTRLWFDVEGTELVPESGSWHRRPTAVLLHGGPGSFDHYYFKPHFSRLAEVAQVIYLDLRDHGRSAWGDPDAWSYEACADDVRAFCDSLGIEAPVVYGHSMGGMIAMVYALRHPGHAGGLVLDSAPARFDVPRLVESFRQAGGDAVAETARRAYGGETTSREEWAACWKLFGRNLPDRGYGTVNAPLNARHLPRMKAFDVLHRLRAITAPTLVLSGASDPVATPEVATELFHALPRAMARQEIIENAGHFPWLDQPSRYWPVLQQFVDSRRPAPAR